MSSSILPNNGKDSPNLNCHIAELLMKPRAFSENVQPFIHVQWLFPLFYYRKKLVRFCEKEKFPNFRHPFLFIKCRSIRMNVYESERERVKIFFPNPEKKNRRRRIRGILPNFDSASLSLPPSPIVYGECGTQKDGKFIDFLQRTGKKNVFVSLKFQLRLAN